MNDDDRIITPEATQRRAAQRGTPVEIMGYQWIFDESVPPVGGVWDRLYDANIVKGSYEYEDIYGAAFVLLLRNYELTLAEGMYLVTSVEAQTLVPAVERALFGRKDEYRSYSDWVNGSLYANGIDPTKVPPHALRFTLEILEATRRTLPAADFCTCHKLADRMRTRRANMRPAPKPIESA